MQLTEDALSHDPTRSANDLGPLAWVLGELRKTLEGAGKTLHRFAREVEQARGSGMAVPAPVALQAVALQLHQSVGALEMVDMTSAAVVLRSMEATAKSFVRRPDLCTEEAAAVVDRASAALIEYLETALTAKPVSAVALFPQYREVSELAEGEKVHPADLWAMQWRWSEPRLSTLEAPLKYDAAVRSRLDQAVLRIVKGAEVTAAREITRLSLGLAAGQSAERPSIFWQISAAFFEAFALGLLPVDLYVKRLASRILMQFSAFSRGDDDVSPSLARDLLFYCALAHAKPGTAPVLTAVRRAFGLARFQPVDYESRRFGRFEPALLATTRKRIATAAETWSAVAGGEAAKLRLAGEHFHLLADAMVRLQPESVELAQALGHAVGDAVRSGRMPAPPLAMEVATSVLYLQAAYEDLDQGDAQLAERADRMAERLDRVRAGGQPQPLEAWMEELYRRVSDRQTMGSVVAEMRASLAAVEKSLDQFFRSTDDRGALAGVSSQLSQMRGVLSVLGLDQASLAVVRMRDSIDRFVADGMRAPMASDAGFEKLGNSLGALGFLVDMLSYQPALAKKLFVYDDALGELRPVMGRVAPMDVQPSAFASDPAADSSTSLTQPSIEPDVVPDSPLSKASVAEASVEDTPDPEAAEPIASEQPAAVVTPATPVAPSAPIECTSVCDEPEVDEELREIFLEEAREVVANGLESIGILAEQAANAEEQTALRRAFHTLKGSSRMVGFAAFGEAAWSMEQLHNAWLADQRQADAPLLELSRSALDALGVWTESISQRADAPFTVGQFRHAADALRLENRLVALVPADAGQTPAFAPGESETLPPQLDAAEIEAFADQPKPEDDEVADLVDSGVEVQDVGFAELTALSDATDEASTAESEATADELPTKPTTAESETADVEEPEMADAEAAEDFAPMSVDDETELMAPRAEDSNSWSEEFDLALEPFKPAPVEPDAMEPEAGEFSPASAEEAIEVDAVESTERVEQIVSLSTEGDAEARQEERSDEAFKVIGTLRVGIPLYSVYLSEADVWSRHLLTDVSEWALDNTKPLPESSIAMAHSLAGSSSTVGFTALSMLARKLERALGHAQIVALGNDEQAQTLVEAAEEVNHLLHQFAAGFLKDASPHVLRALDVVLDTQALPEQRTAIEARAESRVSEPDSIASIEAEAVGADSDESLIAAPIFEPARTVLAEMSLHQVQNLDDDIDAVDALDPDLFPIFEEEALELMPQLGGALRQWSMRPDNEGARAEVMRVLHTLKGSARLAGALRLGEMAHRIESEIASHGGETPQIGQIEPLLGRFDALQKHMDLLRGIAVVGEMQVPTAADAQPSQPASAQAEVTAAGDAVVRPASFTQSVATGAPTRLLSQSVRVRTQLLDRLVNQAGEIMMTRSRLESRVTQLRESLSDLTANLDRLRQQLRDVELQAETQMQSRLAQSKDLGAGFDPLEFDRFTRVQELTRMMAESVNDVATVQRSVQRSVEGAEDDLVAQARQSRELQRDLLRTRMVEFEGISERLYAVVRQSSKDAGKQVKLDITGGNIEMDRGMLDRMTPAFEHLLRNAVAHGIESPEDRAAAGKPQAGTITIELRHAGNDVSVEFRDDGAGLDLDRIRTKARERGIGSAEQELSDAAAAQMIFTPGFSTATTVTELSGRGIGMDVVRSEVDALGGRIETDSSRGKGTGFTMVLPLTTAVTQIVMLRAGEQTVGVPAAVVELVRRVPNDEVDAAYESGTYSYAGESLPFYWCGALLQSSAKSVESAGKTRAVLIIRSAAQRLALHVDEVLRNQEVVVKNLGPQLARLPGLAGMSVLASGTVALIYNPVALATVYGWQARQWAQAHTPVFSPGAPAGAASSTTEARQAPLVLVVDDSITVRRVTQRLLQREGYRVALAADGLQAIERLHDELPVMVLSDIEMPRMDGFDLARNIRGDAAMADLPIVMITSRIGDKHREHAIDLGVQHYLGKPYSEEELLRLVRHYARARASAELH